MSAPHFLTVKRQSLQRRCWPVFVLLAPVCARYPHMPACTCAYLAAAVAEQLPGLIII